MNNQKDLLDISDSNTIRRRKLLPWWIKIFIWIFLFFGAIIPVALIFGIMGNNFQISLYGMETNNPLSITGIGLLTIFFLKAFVAYGLWFEKKWAIVAGIIDAIVGIIGCFIITLYLLFSNTNSFPIRFEFFLLIPYLLWLARVKKKWDLKLHF
jgi:hypothetical protein